MSVSEQGETKGNEITCSSGLATWLAASARTSLLPSASLILVTNFPACTLYSGGTTLEVTELLLRVSDANTEVLGPCRA